MTEITPKTPENWGEGQKEKGGAEPTLRLATYSSATFITDLSIDLLIRKVEVITSLRSYCED